MIRLAILGRPNVGKSSMFNALCNKRLAVVSDISGVTRDYKVYRANLYGDEFEIIDTAGIDQADAISPSKTQRNSSENIIKGSVIKRSMQQQALNAILSADILIFMIDGKVGISYLDCEIADLVREVNKPFIFVANKTESTANLNIDSDLLHKMRLGDPLMISVTHRIGFYELYELIIEQRDKIIASRRTINQASDWKIDSADNTGISEMQKLSSVSSRRSNDFEYIGQESAGIDKEFTDIDEESTGADIDKEFVDIATRSGDYTSVEVGDISTERKSGKSAKERKIGARGDVRNTVALIGRPNVGKSTLFNRMLGWERSIVSEVSGTTRDCISEGCNISGFDCLLVDTAGLRKKKRISDGVEFQSIGQSIATVRRADVVLLMVDAESGLTSQDRKILDMAINEGKSTIFIVNKIDLMKDIRSLEKSMLEELESLDIYSPPIVFMSAASISDLKPLFQAIALSHETHSRMISTSALNRHLRSFINATQLPLAKHNKRPIKLKYFVQTAVRPMTFTLFANYELPDTCIRSLKRSLVEKFKLYGAAIRINVKKSDNPYVLQKNDSRANREKGQSSPVTRKRELNTDSRADKRRSQSLPVTRKRDLNMSKNTVRR